MDPSLVLAGFDVHLGAIQGHMPQAHHASLLTHPQNLNKQTFEGIEVAAAEIADSAVVRLLMTGEHPESKILVEVPFNLAG